MSLTRSIGRNTVLQIIGKALGTVLGLMTIALIQRSLGAEGYGAYTTVMSFMGFFSVIADLGLYLIVLREIAKPSADRERIVGNALSLRIIAAFVILFVGVLVSVFFPYSADIRIGIGIIAVSYFFIAVQQLLVSVFQSALKMVSVVAGELAGRVVLLAIVWWLSAGQASLRSMLLAVVAGSVVNAAILFIRAGKIVKIRLHTDYSYWKYLLKETWPIAVSIVLNLLYFRLDTIFLSVFRSMEEVGLYGAGYKILEILVTFPNMFIGLVMPVLSAVAFSDWARFKQVFQKAFDMLLLAAVPLLVGGFILAEEIIVLIGGQEYMSAAPFFKILMFAVTFLFFGALSGHAVTAIREQRKMVWRYLGVAILGIVLYVVLIPKFGAYGAAIGTVATEGAIMIAGYHMIYSRRRIAPSARLVWKAGVSAVCMGIVVYATRSTHVLVSLSLGMAVYAVALMVTKALTIQMLKLIIQPSSHDT